VRLLTPSGWLWTENRFCFNGLRWYGVFRDLSKTKRAEVRCTYCVRVLLPST
jgi:hypothetical protein